MVGGKTNRRFRLESKNVSTRNSRWLLTGLICALMLLFRNGPVWAGPVENTESKPFNAKQLTFAAGFESNRTLGDHWELRGMYQLESHGKYRLQTGLSYNQATGYINAFFIDLGYEKINNSRYSSRLNFLGNQYPEYNKAVNSIIPYMHWENQPPSLTPVSTFVLLTVPESGCGISFIMTPIWLKPFLITNSV